MDFTVFLAWTFKP